MVAAGSESPSVARIGGVGPRQSTRCRSFARWVLRFPNARGPDRLVDGKSPGAPSKLNADHRRALARGWRPARSRRSTASCAGGARTWRTLLETFAIRLDETTVGRELKALGFAKISARPRHSAQNELAVEAFKKNFPAELAKIRARLFPKGVEIELWWQDEARIGQKNKLTRRWARRGNAPAGAPRPAHRPGHIWRDLSREGEGRRAGHALVRAPPQMPWARERLGCMIKNRAISNTPPRLLRQFRL